VTNLAVDRFNEERAVVCFSGYRWDSYLPHVFMTDDGGTSWSDISEGLPEAPVNDIIADPSIDSCLYVATDFGVYVSWDYGANWNVLGAALPNVPIVDLRLHDPGRKLIAATYGRSMYTFNLDAIVGTSELSQNGKGIHVYPNPFTEEFHIDFELTKDAEIEFSVYNNSGRLVHDQKGYYQGGKNTAIINLGQLPGGIYYIRFTHENNNLTSSVIKK